MFSGHPGRAEDGSEQDSPAVHHYGSCILGIAGLHLLQEFQHPNGGEGHPKVRPAGEVELGHQALRLLVCHISHLQGKERWTQVYEKYSGFPSSPKIKEAEGAADPAWNIHS